MRVHTIRYWEKNERSACINYYPCIISFLGYHPFSEDPQTVGDVVRIHREKYGLSLKKMADKIQLNEVTIQCYEKNRVSKLSRVRKKMEKEIPELEVFHKSVTIPCR